MIRKPPYRKLRGYAFDPSLSIQVDTALINEVIYKVEWEDLDNGKKDKGIFGEYIEVIDYDPSIREIYEPLDLNDKYILAFDGLEPSEGNPQFHQQMVYAVAMTTIKNFENALGRQAMWSSRQVKNNRGGIQNEYVQRLRIYPHGLREANAFYSPQKKSLLFGYFSSYPQDISLHMPGSFVFTCLSHDIIAHETTHALLDGMHSNFITPTNPDVLAFHEAFADIVALFQHFTFPEVLKHQIGKTRGNLESQNLLGELAQEMGKAIGHYGSLRDALGTVDENKVWKLKKPESSDYLKFSEPHERGSILVATIFDAFLNIYKNRISDLIRISSGGTGIIPEGEIHPDLVNRLTNEAAKSASHVLKMCIRALDYCPAIDITFGDYLRAIITADIDSVEDDSRNYRLAIIEAFRKRGIYPNGIKTLSIESLIYEAEDIPILKSQFSSLGEFLRDFREHIIYEKDREKIFEITDAFIGGGKLDNKDITGLHSRINSKFDESKEFEKLTGLVFTNGWVNLGIRTSKRNPQSPSFQVNSLKLASRVGPQGKMINHIILTLIQKSKVTCVKEENTEQYTITPVNPDISLKAPEDSFDFRGSSTLIFDLDTLNLKYVINKPLLDMDKQNLNGKNKLNIKRIIEQYKFLYEDDSRSEFQLYFGDSRDNSYNEPFAFLHRTI